MRESSPNKIKIYNKRYSNEKASLLASKYIYCKSDNINNTYSEEKIEKAYIITIKDYNNAIQNLNSGKKIEIAFYSKKDDIIKLIKDKIEFVIVNEYFIQDYDKSTKFKNKKHVDIYTNETTVLLFFDKNQIFEIKKKFKENNDSLINNGNSNLTNNCTNDKNELIIKKLILLYAFENEFHKAITKSIEDEYDMKNYLLINKNIIDIFKQKYSYSNIKEILDKMNNNLSYKGYLININSLVKNNVLKDIIKNSSKEKFDSQIFQDEKSFFPNLKNFDSFQYPYDFIIVPKSLFDLFYDDFINPKKVIGDFRYNVLLGDNTLFIQDSINKNIFHTYKYDEKNNLEFICSFKYDNELFFYKEVENCIKGKGLEYYLLQRKLDIKNELNPKIDLVKNNQKIGECIIYKQIINENIKYNLVKDILTKNEKLINQYNNMLSKLKNLQSTNFLYL